MSSVPSNATALDDNLLEALNSSRDRINILRLEQDIVSFLQDVSKKVLEVPTLNSYHRLLAHKTGDFYQLTHVSDTTRQLILFHKHPWSQVPTLKLCDIVPDRNHERGTNRSTTPQNHPQQVKIMKRVVNTSESTPTRVASPASQTVGEVKEKDKLDKEERYRAARARIFQGVEESKHDSGNDKNSKHDSRPNSQSNSRDARIKVSRQRDMDAVEFTRRTSELYTADALPHSDSDPIHMRHSQYFQTDSSINAVFSRPPAALSKSHHGVWNPRSSIPLSMANLATLEAQTSKQTGTPVLSHSSVSGLNKTLSPPSRSLAPPTNASANLWGPPASPSPLVQKNASALGLNLSANPWTPRQSVVISRHAKEEKVSRTTSIGDHNEDPANILQNLALDEK